MPSGRSGRRCTICSDPRVAQINAALADGQRQAVVAATFGISTDAIWRHARAHLGAAVVAGDTPGTTAAGDIPADAVGTLLRTQAKLLRMIDRCEKLRQTASMVGLVREVRQVVETIARMSGATDSSGALRRASGPGSNSAAIRERLLAKADALGLGCAPRGLTIEVKQGNDGRWTGKVPALPGVLAYGDSEADASRQAIVLGLRALADMIERGQPVPDEVGAFFPFP
jgi:predicted RNase H-like HicB family nuclease